MLKCFFAQLPSAEPWNPYSLSSFGFAPSISRPDSVYGQHDALSRQAYCFHSIRSGHQVIRPKRTPQKRWISCHLAPQYLCISETRSARLVLLSRRAPSVPCSGTVGAISLMQEARDGRERPLNFTSILLRCQERCLHHEKWNTRHPSRRTQTCQIWPLGAGDSTYTQVSQTPTIWPLSYKFLHPLR